MFVTNKNSISIFDYKIYNKQHKLYLKYHRKFALHLINTILNLAYY